MSTVLRGSDNFDTALLLGVGQTWQDLTASRAFGTTYTNTTGKPIQVIADGINTGGASSIQGVVNAVSLGLCQQATANYRCSCSFIVPIGATYSVVNQGGATINRWVELR